MNDFDNLPVIAEIAVAFAGFSALAGVIGQSVDTARFDLERLRTVVLTSLLAVGCALIPIAMSEFIGINSDLWRYSAWIVFPLNVAVLVTAIRKGNETRLHAEDKYYVWFGYGIELPIEATIILCALNAFPASNAGFYITYLVLLLFQCGIAFLLLISSIIAGQSNK